MHTVSNASLRIARLSISFTALLVSTLAQAAPGDLDAGFNSGGIVINPLSSSRAKAHAVAVLPDGKILAAGETCGISSLNCDFLVERFNSDGSLDTSFNGTGAVVSDYITNNDYAYAVALTSAGRITVAGYTCSTSIAGSPCNFLLARYLSGGGYDTTLAGSGVVADSLGVSDARAYAMTLQPDGKILLGGYSFNGANDDFTLVRYNSDGSRDLGFGSGGAVTTDFATNNDQINAIGLLPDGSIVAAGQSCSSSVSCDFALAKYTADGTPDTLFNGTGKVVTSFGTGDDEALALVVQPDAAVVLAGQSCNSSDTSCVFALARYNPDGTPDGTFNPGGSPAGTVTTAISSTVSIATSVALQPDGKLIAAGYDYSGASFDYALVRYGSDGSLDTSFGGGGNVTTDISGNSGDQVNAVALQPDGKIVAAGETNGASSSVVSLARYFAVDTPWALTPDTFTFANVDNVDTGSLQTSGLITVSGLGAGIEVPVRVLNGSYAKNGSTSYTEDLGWAKNGDQFNVQHTASSAPGQAYTTALLIGGIVAADNTTVTLGTTTSATFTSTTKSGASSGGGMLGLLSLMSLAAAAIARRRLRCESTPCREVCDERA